MWPSRDGALLGITSTWPYRLVLGRLGCDSANRDSRRRPLACVAAVLCRVCVGLFYGCDRRPSGRWLGVSRGELLHLPPPCCRLKFRGKSRGCLARRVSLESTVAYLRRWFPSLVAAELDKSLDFGAVVSRAALSRPPRPPVCRRIRDHPPSSVAKGGSNPSNVSSVSSVSSVFLLSLSVRRLLVDRFRCSPVMRGAGGGGGIQMALGSFFVFDLDRSKVSGESVRGMGVFLSSAGGVRVCALLARRVVPRFVRIDFRGARLPGGSTTRPDTHTSCRCPHPPILHPPLPLFPSWAERFRSGAASVFLGGMRCLRLGMRDLPLRGERC